MAEYVFTVDWFSEGEGNFKKLLSEFKGQDDLRFLEIGSFEGRSSVWILENILIGKNNKLKCIEVSVLPKLRSNLSGFADKVEIFEGVISDFFKTNEERYDFIYIDGSHIGPDVLLDAVFSFEMLKVGGIMLFDDYLLNESQDGPKNIETYTIFKDLTNPILYPRLAVDSFVKLYYEQCTVLDIPNNFQLAIRKTYDSFSTRYSKRYYDENGNRRNDKNGINAYNAFLRDINNINQSIVTQ